MRKTLVGLIIAVVAGATLNASGLCKDSGEAENSKLPEVNDTNFQQEVLKSKKPVLVDFWAPWCGPCRLIAPEIEEIANDYGTKLKVVRVDVDQAHQTSMDYNINGIPDVCIFKGGKLVDHSIGAVPKAVLTKMIDKHL